MSQAPHASLPQAFFLDTGGAGQRFCLYHPPRPQQGGAPPGRVLYLHPFAEELNCTRRMAASQARALAQAGHAVLQIDLLGCGDSSGDFGDATWAAWLDDAQAAHRWLMEQAEPGGNNGPLWLWGTRAGALLAAQLAGRLQEAGSGPAHLLLWQPVASGQHMLQQFLRLHAASQWLGTGSTGASETPPAQALAQGHTVHIAGYPLSPALAQGLSDARLTPPTSGQPRRLVWLEVSAAESPAVSPATNKPLAAWRAAGWHVQAEAVHGQAFWQTVDTDGAPALIAATLAALAGTQQP